MPNLYELHKEVNQAFEDYLYSFDHDTGEQIVDDVIVEARLDAIKNLENRQGESIEWILSTRANSVARQEMMKNEINRLQEQIKKEQKTVDKMEGLFSMFMPPDKLEKKTSFGVWQASYRKSEGTIVSNEKELPENLKTKTLVPEFDLMIIAEELKEKGLEYKIEEKPVLKDVKKWIEQEEEKINAQFIGDDDETVKNRNEALVKLHSIAYVEQRRNLTIV